MTNNFNVSSLILFRVGAKEKIDLDYKKNRISFSCAANWIDYALKERNDTTGDMLDSTIGYLPSNDTRPDKYGDNILKLINPKNEQYIFYQPVILMPALSFYGVRKETEIDLKKYAKYLGYATDKPTSVLIIENLQMFFKELKEQIPYAIDNDKDNFTDYDFTVKYDRNNPLIANDISYDKYDGGYFYEAKNWLKQIFIKRSIYKVQSEARFVIPNISFKQRLLFNGYDYNKNTLYVKLPNLKNYAKVFDLSKLDILIVNKHRGEWRYTIKIRNCTLL